MDGALVRGRRARVGGARDEDEDAAAAEPRERVGCGGNAGERPDVVAVLGQARDELGPRHRTERDHEVIGVEAADRRLGRPAAGVDLGDLLLDERDPALGEQRPRPAPFGDRAETDERPQLAEAHPEVRIVVDEDDLVVVAEEPLQLECRRDAAEAAAEDEGARAHATPAARSSSSWRSSIRRIFPVSVFGRSGTNSTSRG